MSEKICSDSPVCAREKEDAAVRNVEEEGGSDGGWKNYVLVLQGWPLFQLDYNYRNNTLCLKAEILLWCEPKNIPAAVGG